MVPTIRARMIGSFHSYLLPPQVANSTRQVVAMAINTPWQFQKEGGPRQGPAGPAELKIAQQPIRRQLYVRMRPARYPTGYLAGHGPLPLPQQSQLSLQHRSSSSRVLRARPGTWEDPEVLSGGSLRIRCAIARNAISG